MLSDHLFFELLNIWLNLYELFFILHTDSIPCNVPQILINREPLANHLFDIELYGDCDVIVRHLCALLGWSPPNKLGIEKPSSNVLPSLTDTSISTSACLYSEVPLIDVARIAESENVPSTRAQEPLIETFSTTPHAKTRPYSHFKHKGQLSNASMTGTPSSGFTHFSSYSSDAAYIANRSSDRTDLVSPVIQTSGHVADYASAKGERAALESGDHSEIEEDGPHTAWSVADFLPSMHSIIDSIF
ncbi:unnamed protein product [Protopolystoma xenopodis]|uniref:Uncharacterized protein n=1 Tax=Protopolystoma xenopodis TaxID=117903 RepID=A0A448X5X8_9PLAT|nr:unnamed protein product [Protopolystoma xenopodis]